METMRTEVPVGIPHTPLLEEGQVTPGCLVTGVGMAHTWQVVAREGDKLHIYKMPVTRVATYCSTHHLVKQGQGETCSVCSLRIQPISSFLPIKPGQARAHIVQTAGMHLLRPEEHTVFTWITESGSLEFVTYREGEGWSKQLPLVPALYKLWALPSELSAIVRECSVITEATEAEAAPTD